MKTRFSKCLSLLLTAILAASAVFTSGCANTTSSISAPKAVKGEYPKSLDIAYPGFFSRNYNYDAENGDKWLQDISARYDVDLNVTTLANDANGIIRSLLTGGRTAEVITGFVYMNNSNLVSMYANPENILPLEDYLKDNLVWKSLPQAVRDAFTVDGHVWAIPCDYRTISPQIRAYDSEVLASVGMQAPTTIDEFTQFAQKAQALIKSGSTENTVNVPISGYPFICVADILRAYGIYTSTYGQICYDPVEDCIVDGFLKPEAEEALEYLRDLYNKGLLNAEFIGTDNNPYVNVIYKQEGYNTAYYSTLTAEMAYNGALSRYSCVTEMTKGGNVYPQILDISFAGYVLSANTPEPEKCVNFLLDLFFGSKYNYYETRYGSEKNYTISSDGTISINSNEDGSFPIWPNLLNRIEGLNMGDEYSGYNPQYGDSTFQYNVGVALNTLRKETIQKGTAVEIPVVNQYAVRLCRWYTRDLMQNLTLTLNNCFVNAITDSSKTVKQVLDEYRSQMRAYGAQHLLDEANAIIDRTGFQTY